MRLRVLLERLQLQMWFIPALFGLAAVIASIVFVSIDASAEFAATDVWFLFGGSADGARSMLSTVATAMLTFTGLVFTVTMLVLQQASSQHSPRVLRTFLRDRKNQIVLGLFVATFLFTLLVLRQVRGDGGAAEQFVPGLSIFAAFVLLVASVGAFVFYIDHMANAVRATTILDNIASETLSALDRLFPKPVGQAAEEEVSDLRPLGQPLAELTAQRSGVITAIDPHELVKAASVSDDHADDRNGEARGSRHDTRPSRFVEMLPMIGDYVTDRTTVFRVWGEWSEKELDGVRGAINTGPERTVQQDLAFGLRQLVDVALRALSPAMNDPTTAVQALDRIHEVMQRLADREIPEAVRRDEHGTARLLLPRPGWEDYVLLAVEEIRLSGQQQLQVQRRLRDMLFSLLSSAPAHRHAVLRRELRLIDETVDRELSGKIDRLAMSVDTDGGRASVKTIPK